MKKIAIVCLVLALAYSIYFILLDRSAPRTFKSPDSDYEVQLPKDAIESHIRTVEEFSSEKSVYMDAFIHVYEKNNETKKAIFLIHRVELLSGEDDAYVQELFQEAQSEYFLNDEYEQVKIISKEELNGQYEGIKLQSIVKSRDGNESYTFQILLHVEKYIYRATGLYSIPADSPQDSSDALGSLEYSTGLSFIDSFKIIGDVSGN